MRTIFKWVARIIGLFILAILAFALVLIVSGWSAFGKAPEGDRLARMEKSSHFSDGIFHNVRGQWVNYDAIYENGLFGDPVPEQNPSAPIPTAHPAQATLTTLPASGLRVTWFGHSSSLVELDGVRVLTDPIWSERASPVQWMGPQRWFQPLIPIADLPPIDAVVVSHDHYDHLDMATIKALAAASSKTRFIVPLGVGAHLEYWGVAPSRITEVEWWDEVPVGTIKIVSTPARHATGRLAPSSNKVFWSGYAMIGPKHRAWYSGDTGYLPEFAEIGKRFAPFDVTLIESGQYNPAWPDNHVGPEDAVRTNKLVGGKVLLPVHWALFSLAPHGWTEPVERVLAAAKCQRVTLALPRPGQSVDFGEPLPTTKWWPDAPYHDAKTSPQQPTQNGNPKLRIPTAPCVRPSMSAS